MKYEWDEDKEANNEEKHGVWFDEAQTVWSDTNSIDFFDPEHRGKNMKKEYDLNKLKRRPKSETKVDPNATKIHISIRVDAVDIINLKNEAKRLGIPYQTFICSILHRYTKGELLDKNSPDIKKLLKSVS